MKIMNKSNNLELATEIILANTFWLRLKGLLGHDHLLSEQALVLEPCSSVHTCFMRFSIDVIFLDHDNKVIHLEENLVPWRFTPPIRKAHAVIELSAGTIRTKGITLGDTLIFE